MILDNLITDVPPIQQNNPYRISTLQKQSQ